MGRAASRGEPALELRRDGSQRQPTVVIVTDRTKLDRQDDDDHDPEVLGDHRRRRRCTAGAGRPAQVRDALIAWFRRHAERRLPERVAAWRAKAGVPMPPVIVSNQQKRWGSCDRNGVIRLNWRIIQAPMRLVDYIVVHELVHLRHRGHGREYSQAVGRVMPDYERQRENLRMCGAGLAW